MQYRTSGIFNDTQRDRFASLLSAVAFEELNYMYQNQEVPVCHGWSDGVLSKNEILSVMREIPNERLTELLTSFIVTEHFELCEVIKRVFEERRWNL